MARTGCAHWSWPGRGCQGGVTVFGVIFVLHVCSICWLCFMWPLWRSLRSLLETHSQHQQPLSHLRSILDIFVDHDLFLPSLFHFEVAEGMSGWLECSWYTFEFSSLWLVTWYRSYLLACAYLSLRCIKTPLMLWQPKGSIPNPSRWLDSSFVGHKVCKMFLMWIVCIPLIMESKPPPIAKAERKPMDANSMKCLRRVLSPRVDGSYLAPQQILDDWKDVSGGGRDNVLNLWAKSGCDKARPNFRETWCILCL